MNVKWELIYVTHMLTVLTQLEVMSALAQLDMLEMESPVVSRLD